MEKTRLEAFTDGIFAIVVTLLVLDIHLPAGTTAQNLGANLIHVIPTLSTYVLSYLIVGLYWIFHHSVTRMFKSVDSRILCLNILHLMLIGLIPFSTSVLSEFSFTTWAIVLYGVNILAINLSGWFVIHYLYRHQNLAVGTFSRAAYRSQRRLYIKIASLYAVAIALSFIAPWVSVYIYGLITLYMILTVLFPQLSWRRSLDIAGN